MLILFGTSINGELLSIENQVHSTCQYNLRSEMKFILFILSRVSTTMALMLLEVRYKRYVYSMVCLTQLPSDNKRSAVVLLYSMLPCSLCSTVLFQISDCLNASYFLFSLWGAPCNKHVLPL